MQRVHTIPELQQLAKRRVPRMFWDYIESGSWTQTTLRRNEEDFQRIKFRQRIARDMSDRSTSISMAGYECTMPVAIAPTGFCGMVHANGEILAAQAAADFRVPFTLSTMSICSIEDVAAHSSAPFWFQIYVMRDREFSSRLIQRAKAAQCSALVVTLDLQVMGQRHADIKNGLSAPPKLNLNSLMDLAMHPRWCMQMLRAKRLVFGNIVGHVEGITDPSSLSAWTAEQFDPRLNWDDVKRIKDEWGGKLILKGILDAEDAVKAFESGADAIVVSNHGGRQLDGADSSIAVLPEIVAAVNRASNIASVATVTTEAARSFVGGSHNNNTAMEVWLDGGVRSGQDVLKAIALGARGVMLGRSYLYGLGAGGQAGVTRALEIIHKELDLSMALCGYRDIKDIDSTILRDCPFESK